MKILFSYCNKNKKKGTIMKRVHIHVGVEDLNQSMNFYNALFGAQPTKVKDDYAKWMLDDPYMNFAISTRMGNQGIDHLGIQVDGIADLENMRENMSAANISTHSDGEAACCYAKSEKSWVKDPNGIAWEAYHTMEDMRTFSGNAKPDQKANTDCCIPTEKTARCCG